MKYKIGLLAVLVSIAVSGNAFSHEGKLHKGKPIEGSILNLKENAFSLKTEKEVIPIELTKDTTFETGPDGEKATKENLSDKLPVKVFGTKLPSGVLVAKEVMIIAPPSYSGKTQ